MSSETNKGPNEPLEFKIIEQKGDGFNSFAWYHGAIKLGNDKDFEGILNELGGAGWDVVQFIPPARVLLRRKAR